MSVTDTPYSSHTGGSTSSGEIAMLIMPPLGSTSVRKLSMTPTSLVSKAPGSAVGTVAGEFVGEVPMMVNSVGYMHSVTPLVVAWCPLSAVTFGAARSFPNPFVQREVSESTVIPSGPSFEISVSSKETNLSSTSIWYGKALISVSIFLIFAFS